MPTTVQEFLATSIKKAAEDLEESFLRIPEDKRDWNPMGDARSAIDQMAECAMLNGNSAGMLTDKQWPKDYSFDDYSRQKAELAKDWSAVQTLLYENASKVAEAVGSLTPEEMDQKVDMPWGPMSLAQIAAYPTWNMSYHAGQINYIASMLGCLE